MSAKDKRLFFFLFCLFLQKKPRQTIKNGVDLQWKLWWSNEKNWGVGPYGIVGNILDWDIVVNKF